MITTKTIAKLLLIAFLPLTQAVAEESTMHNNTQDSQQSSPTLLNPDIYHFCNRYGELIVPSKELKQWLLIPWDIYKVNDAFSRFKQYYSKETMSDAVQTLFDTVQLDSFNLPNDDGQSRETLFVEAFLEDIKGIHTVNAVQSIKFPEQFNDRLTAITISESEVITFPTGQYNRPQYAVLPHQTPVTLVGQFGDKDYNWNINSQNGETSWVIIWHAQGFSLIKAGQLAVVNNQSEDYIATLNNGEIKCLEPPVTIYGRLVNDAPESSLPTPVIIKEGVKYMPEIEYSSGTNIYYVLHPVIWSFSETLGEPFRLKQVKRSAACHFNNEHSTYELDCKDDPNKRNQADKNSIQVIIQWLRYLIDAGITTFSIDPLGRTTQSSDQWED